MKIIARLLFAVLRFSLAAFRLALCLRDLRGGGFRFDCRGDFSFDFSVGLLGSCDPERVRVISIARLRTLPPLHLQPIDVIVFDDPCVEILS